MAGRDRRHGAREERTVGAATVVVAGEESDVAKPQRAGECRVGRRLEIVATDAVDIGRREPGVIERGADRGDGELRLGGIETLGIGRLADADDRRTVPHRRLQAYRTRSGKRQGRGLGAAAVAAGFQLTAGRERRVAGAR
jgi:hypothetical protein